MKQFLLKSWALLLLMMVSMGAWADKTYTHVFSTKPATGTTTLSGLSWSISASTLNGYQKGYAGVQIGAKNSSGNISLSTSSSFANNGETKIKEIRLWLNTGGSTVNYSVSVGGTSITGSGSVTKNSSCNGDYSKASCITFTPSAGHETGIVSVSVSEEDGPACYICAIEIDTEANAAAGPVDASWSVEPSEIAVKTGKAATATITTNYDGELIAETNDANVATCSFEDGVLTVTGVSAGTTTICFLGDATSKYNAIEKEVAVTVTDPAVFDPSNFVIADFVEDIPAADDGVISFDLGNYSFEVKKNNGTTAPTVATNAKAGNEKDMRIYAKGTITISSETKQFNGVVFNISTQGLTRLAPITADCGTVAEQASGDETVTWTSAVPVSSVTFTVGDGANYGSDGSSKAGQLDFVSMSIQEVTTINITTPEGYSTFVCEDAVKMPEGVEGSAATVEGGKLTLAWEYKAGDVVPAGTPILVKGTKGEHTASIATGGTAPEANLLVANLKAAEEDANILADDVDAKCYVLSYDKSGENLGFYWFTATGDGDFKVPVGKVFLALPGSVKGAPAFRLFDEETAVENLKAADAENEIRYNIQGQRVNANAKGIVIKHGKKYIIK